MIILTSPAKTQDFTSPYPSTIKSLPIFKPEVEKIVQTLQQFSLSELKKLYGVSDKIAILNFDRLKNWEKNKEIERPAIFAYHGDIFRGIFPRTYSHEQANYLQDSLRIISGLYGLVRPYDLIRPYRLEMIAPLTIGKSKNLYEFWMEKTTNYLIAEIKKSKDQILVNLASDEYGNSVDFSKLKTRVIKIGFRQKKGSRVLNIGLISKRARGFMIEYMVKHMISDPEKLKGFDVNGYRLFKETKDGLTFLKNL